MHAQNGPLRKTIALACAWALLAAGCSAPRPAPTVAVPAPGTPPAVSPAPATPDPTRVEEAILILEPGPGWRLVGTLRVAGIADPTFEQNLVVRVLLDDGSLLLETYATIAAEAGRRGPFEVEIPFHAGGEVQAFIQVFSVSPRDGGIEHLNAVGVILADDGEPIVRAVAASHQEQLVLLAPLPAARLTGGLARIEGFGLASFEQTLVISILGQDGSELAMAPVMVAAPDLGYPGPFAIDLPFTVAFEQPGRVVVADLSPAFGGPVHVTSVHVTLAP